MIEIKIQIKQSGSKIKVRVGVEQEAQTRDEVNEGKAVMAAVRQHSATIQQICEERGSDMFMVTGKKEQVGDLIKRRFEQEEL